MTTVPTSGRRRRLPLTAHSHVAGEPACSLNEMAPVETFVFKKWVKVKDPNKLCNKIYNQVYDACLQQDHDSKVTCEVLMDKVFLKITTLANVDYLKIANELCIQFVSDEAVLGFEWFEVFVSIAQQRPGDLVHISGYATDETPEMMPIGYVLAAEYAAVANELREEGTFPWLGPNGNIHIAVEYGNENGAMVPTRVHAALITTQPDKNVTKDEFDAGLKQVIKNAVPEKYLDKNTIFDFRPSFYIEIGSPHGYSSLIDGKIINGTFGGWGAFSNDKHTDNIARQAAKSIVADGLARRCKVDVYYKIGAPNPLSVSVDTYGTGKKSDTEILEIVKKRFDFGQHVLAMCLDHKTGGGDGSLLKTTLLPMGILTRATPFGSTVNFGSTSVAAS